MRISAFTPSEEFLYRSVWLKNVLKKKRKENDNVNLTNGGLYSTTDCSTLALQTDKLSHLNSISHKNRTGNLTNTKKVIGHQIESFSFVLWDFFFPQASDGGRLS